MGLLKSFDLREVVGANEELRRMVPSQAAANFFVDEPLVLDRRLPAHPTQQTDRLH
jgi:hypothetical protein